MTTSIFVGNIAYGAMEMEIRDLFSQHGTVQNVRFIMDLRKGRFKGYGFVTMPDKDAELAIRELDGADFQGRCLKVREAKSSADSERRSA